MLETEFLNFFAIPRRFSTTGYAHTLTHPLKLSQRGTSVLKEVTDEMHHGPLLRNANSDKHGVIFTRR